MSAKTVTDELRANFTADLAAFLAEKYGCDVCHIAAGKLMIPCVDSEGNDRWARFDCIIPKEASEENGTDGYALQTEYNIKLQAAADRKKAQAEKAAKAKAKSKSKTE